MASYHRKRVSAKTHGSKHRVNLQGKGKTFCSELEGHKLWVCASITHLLSGNRFTSVVDTLSGGLPLTDSLIVILPLQRNPLSLVWVREPVLKSILSTISQFYFPIYLCLTYTVHRFWYTFCFVLPNPSVWSFPWQDSASRSHLDANFSGVSTRTPNKPKGPYGSNLIEVQLDVLIKCWQKRYAQRSIIDLSIVLFCIHSSILYQPVSKHKHQKNWKQRPSCCNSRGTTSCSSPRTTHFFSSATVTRPSPSVSTTRKAKSASCGVSSGAPVAIRGEDMIHMIIDLIALVSLSLKPGYNLERSSKPTYSPKFNPSNTCLEQWLKGVVPHG